MNFLGIGPTELLMVSFVAFIFLGPARMVEIARSLGNVAREVRRTTYDLPSLLSPEEPLDQPHNYEAKGRAQEPGTDMPPRNTDGR